MDSILLHFFPSSYPGAYSRSSSHPCGVLSSGKDAFTDFLPVIIMVRFMACRVVFRTVLSPFVEVSPGATVYLFGADALTNAALRKVSANRLLAPDVASTLEGIHPLPSPFSPYHLESQSSAGMNTVA